MSRVDSTCLSVCNISSLCTISLLSPLFHRAPYQCAQSASLNPAWSSITQGIGSFVDVFEIYKHGVMYKTLSVIYICTFLHSTLMFSTCISFVASIGCMWYTMSCISSCIIPLAPLPPTPVMHTQLSLSFWFLWSP